MKYFIIESIFIVYICIGLIAGIAMEKAIPALNYKGVIFITLTWPAQMACAQLQCDSIPDNISHSFFTF